MQTVSIAEEKDIPQLVNLLDILFSQESEFVPDHKKQSDGLRLIIQNEHVGRILVLREQDKIIGMLNILFTISTALGCRVAIFEDMVIQPEYRGKGYGTTLLSDGLQLAKMLECKRVTLLTDHDNSTAIAFYKKLGFFNSSMIPLRRLL